jgi:DNA polymerase III alpha subunit
MLLYLYKSTNGGDTMGRFECHSHTQFSNIRMLDCTNNEKKLVKRAFDIGLSGIAITDHETLSNAIRVNKSFFIGILF